MGEFLAGTWIVVTASTAVICALAAVFNYVESRGSWGDESDRVFAARFALAALLAPFWPVAAAIGLPVAVAWAVKNSAIQPLIEKWFPKPTDPQDSK